MVNGSSRKLLLGKIALRDKERLRTSFADECVDYVLKVIYTARGCLECVYSTCCMVHQTKKCT